MPPVPPPPRAWPANPPARRPEPVRQLPDGGRDRQGEAQDAEQWPAPAVAVQSPAQDEAADQCDAELTRQDRAGGGERGQGHQRRALVTNGLTVEQQGDDHRHEEWYVAHEGWAELEDERTR